MTVDDCQLEMNCLGNLDGFGWCLMPLLFSSLHLVDYVCIMMFWMCGVKKKKKKKNRPFHIENLKHPAVMSGDLAEKG